MNAQAELTELTADAPGRGWALKEYCGEGHWAPSTVHLLEETVIYIYI